MIERKEDGKLFIKTLDIEIFFDDIFDMCESSKEINKVLNKFVELAYYEALEMGKEKGFKDIEDVLEIEF